MVRGSLVAAVALLLLSPAAQAAQDYVGNTPPVVEGVEFSRPVDPPAVLAQEADPEDRIPITGGDVLGLTALGLGSLGAGLALTRRARRTD